MTVVSGNGHGNGAPDQLVVQAQALLILQFCHNKSKLIAMEYILIQCQEMTMIIASPTHLHAFQASTEVHYVT
jgi:hypothetical protein